MVRLCQDLSASIKKKEIQELKIVLYLNSEIVPVISKRYIVNSKMYKYIKDFIKILDFMEE